MKVSRATLSQLTLHSTEFTGMAFTSRQICTNIQNWGDLDIRCCDCRAGTHHKGPRGETGVPQPFSSTTGIQSVSNLLFQLTWDAWGLPTYDYGLSRGNFLHSAPSLCLGLRHRRSTSGVRFTRRFLRDQPCRLWLQLWGSDPKHRVQFTKQSRCWQFTTMLQ